ncbi:MAG: winged helix-turn-helix domain-containing protein [Chloroflexota bacterium]
MSDPLDLTRYFGSLRAETESAWLAQAYLPPRLFGQMTEPRSIIALGEDGSGKTAFELYLKDYAAHKSPRLLTASWRLVLPEDSAPGNQAAETFVSQAMDSLSFAFLQMISHDPSIFANAPSWARDFMHWFVQAFLRGDRQYHLSRLADGAVTDVLDVVTRLLSEQPREILPPAALPSSILSHLTSAIKAFGLEAIWIFLDGLDALFRISPERLEKFLVNFLSTLDLFEEPIFVFKIIVSAELGRNLQKARGILTRRFGVYPLKWQEEELTRLTEKRIALSTGRDDLSLASLCKDADWLQWLRKHGGKSPRGWLELTYPMLAAYLKKGEPLTRIEWPDVYRQSPPPLRLDLEAGRVFIGWGEVPVAGIGYKLLRYLYENRQRPCKKSELYEHVYKEFYNTEIAAKKKDNKRSIRIDWEGPLDTALYRLRQAVEWDTRDDVVPLYIISERGKGQIHLENVV